MVNCLAVIGHGSTISTEDSILVTVTVPQVNSPGMRSVNLVMPVPLELTIKLISPILIGATHSPASGGPDAAVVVVVCCVVGVVEDIETGFVVVGWVVVGVVCATSGDVVDVFSIVSTPPQLKLAAIISEM